MGMKVEVVEVLDLVCVVVRNVVFEVVEGVFEDVEVVEMGECRVKRLVVVRNVFDISLECSCSDY